MRILSALLVASISVLWIAGCQESGYIVTGESLLQPSESSGNKSFGASGDQFSRGLDAEIKNVTDKDKAYSVPTPGSLPDDLASEPLFKKLIDANYAAIHADKQGDAFGRPVTIPQASEKIGFNADDFRHFVTNSIGKLGLGAPAAHSGATTQTSVFAKSPERKTTQLLQKYLVLYYQGKFVTRDGKKLDKPQISGTIGNDTITGFLTIVLEATFDGFYQMPVYYKRKENVPPPANTSPQDPPADLDSWATSTGEEPSAAVVNPNLITPFDNGFDNDKWQTVQFFGNVAGDQSTIVSGMIIKSLGHIDAGPMVVFGGISIGDNETLGKVIDTFFQVSSRRTTEALTYKYVRNHPDATKWTGALKAIYEIIKDLESKSGAKSFNAQAAPFGHAFAMPITANSTASVFSVAGGEMLSRNSDTQLSVERELADIQQDAQRDPQGYLTKLRLGVAAKERHPTIELNNGLGALNREMLAYSHVPAEALMNARLSPYDKNAVQAESYRLMLNQVKSNQERLFVVNGVEDFANVYPDCVALFNDSSDPNSFGGSGVLIAPNVVLTAAHCYRRGYCNYVFVGKDARDASSGKFYKVDPAKKYLLNENYNELTAPFDDLCVLVLTENVQGATPRKIATMAQINQAPGLRIVGYGTNDPYGNGGYALRRIGDVPFLSRCCTAEEAAANRLSCNPGKELANGEQLHRTTCFGDSGGPLLIQDQQTREWLVAAITSRGLPNLPAGNAPCTVGGIDEIVDCYRAQIRELVPGAQWPDAGPATHP